MAEHHASGNGRNAFLIRRIRDEREVRAALLACGSYHVGAVPAVEAPLVYVLYDPAASAADPPVGAAILVRGERPGTLVVRSFGIIAAYRGRGLSHVLLTALADAVRSQGYTHLYAALPPANERAIAAVRRAGFSPAAPPAGCTFGEARSWFELELG